MTRDELKTLSAEQLERYFMDNAQFMPDAPSRPYFIRTGSQALTSDDTMDLRQRWEAWVRG